MAGAADRRVVRRATRVKRGRSQAVMVTVRIDLYRVAAAAGLAFLALLAGWGAMRLGWSTALVFAGIVLVWTLLALALYPGDLTPGSRE